MELAGVREEGMPGLHIYTKGAQLGRKQIFGDYGLVLSLVAFRCHASYLLKIVRVVIIMQQSPPLKLLYITDCL